MIPKKQAKEILERFRDADFSAIYPRHFYKELAYEYGLEIDTIRRICEGYTHRETYLEVMRDITASFLHDFREFADTHETFLVSEWNAVFSGNNNQSKDYTKICLIMNVELIDLFHRYKSEKTNKNRKED